jgi:hypothetical protein
MNQNPFIGKILGFAPTNTLPLLETDSGGYLLLHTATCLPAGRLLTATVFLYFFLNFLNRTVSKSFTFRLYESIVTPSF